MTTINNNGNGNNPFDTLGVSTASSKDQAAADKKNKLGQDQFLELMIAQLKNQDPLKPMQNGEFLGQMAQFATVSGIQDLQNSVNQLTSAFQSNQALQASSLVGRSVLSTGNKGVLEAGGSLDGAVDLPASTTSLSLKITDSSGQLVRHLEMGPQAAGSVRFSWDGQTDAGVAALPGNYTVTAEAIQDGKVTGVDASVAAKVASVNLGANGQGMVLNLANGLGSVPLSDVKQIL
jgi:flagellar basal-body rod modification protein FlgD